MDDSKLVASSLSALDCARRVAVPLRQIGPVERGGRALPALTHMRPVARRSRRGRESAEGDGKKENQCEESRCHRAHARQVARHGVSPSHESTDSDGRRQLSPDWAASVELPGLTQALFGLSRGGWTRWPRCQGMIPQSLSSIRSGNGSRFSGKIMLRRVRFNDVGSHSSRAARGRYGHSPMRSPAIFTRDCMLCPAIVICVRTSAE